MGGGKLHGALMPGSGAHCYLYLDRRIWGSPPPLEAQPVASSGRPQPVAGPRSELKSILDVEQTLKGHPYVRKDTVQRHKYEEKGKNREDHLSPWELEFHTANRRYTLGLSCNNDGPDICHGWLCFPSRTGKSETDLCLDIFLNAFGFASIRGNGITKPIKFWDPRISSWVNFDARRGHAVKVGTDGGQAASGASGSRQPVAPEAAAASPAEAGLQGPSAPPPVEECKAEIPAEGRSVMTPLATALRSSPNPLPPPPPTSRARCGPALRGGASRHVPSRPVPSVHQSRPPRLSRPSRPARPVRHARSVRPPVPPVPSISSIPSIPPVAWRCWPKVSPKELGRGWDGDGT